MAVDLLASQPRGSANGEVRPAETLTAPASTGWHLVLLAAAKPAAAYHLRRTRRSKPAGVGNNEPAQPHAGRIETKDLVLCD
jgi:hypothetical protein